MGRVSWTQNNFNAGEWSPLTYGRSDLAKYKNALAKCLNYLCTTQGGLTRRPGTRYVAEVKNSANPVRLVRFEFSITQAYILEFGPGYIRFYTNDGQLVNAGTPYEISTPYIAADLQALAFTQSADTMYIAHPSYPPRKLQRVGPLNWTLTSISFLDGPYLPVNTTKTTLIPAAITGTGVSVTTGPVRTITGAANNGSGLIRITSVAHGYVTGDKIKIASVTGTTEANGFWTVTKIDADHFDLQASTFVNAYVSGGTAVYQGTFVSTDVGRCLRIKSGASWGWGRIASVIDNSSITLDIVGDFVATTGSAFWRIGLWGSVNGYPGAVTFNQDRLIWAGCTNYPNRLDASNTSDYENMQPTQADSTVIDSNALSFSLNANSVNVINWMVSDEWGLLVGTATSEWVVAASNQQNAVTPTNVTAKQTTSYGTAQIPPIRMGKCTLFIQRTKRKLREMNYQYTLNTFQAPDISLTSEHLTKGGIKQMAAQLTPQPILWMVRNDGTLVSMCYDREQDVYGWSSHQIGGYSDAGQSLPAIVESVATIPAPAIDRDEVWMVVQRYVNGSVKRYVEVMTKLWEDGDVVANSAFVDSSSAYSGTPTTTVTGLTWLVGQTVSVLADGSVHPDCVVSNTGTITLNRSASTVQVGLRYTSLGQTMRIEAGGNDGSAQGKIKRIHRAIMRLFQSIGLNMIATNGNVTPEPFRTTADLMDNPVALFTGDKRFAVDGSYETEGQVSWSQTDPLPSNVLMVSAQLETQDG